MSLKSKIILIICVIAIIVYGMIMIFKNNYEISKVNDESSTNNVVVTKPGNLKIEEDEVLKSKVLKNAVVIKNLNDYMYVYNAEKGVFSISYPKDEDKEFKKGQEVNIFFNDEMIIATNPPRLNEIEKIEVLKEETEIEVPSSVWSNYYSDTYEVDISVNNCNTTGISISITDKNEYPIVYTNKYRLEKISRNTVSSDDTSTNNIINVDNDTNTTITNSSKNNNQDSYLTGSVMTRQQYKDLLLVNNSDGAYSDSIKENIKKDKYQNTVIEKIINWKDICGNLKKGDYKFRLECEGKISGITVSFSVEDNGSVSHNDPKMER